MSNQRDVTKTTNAHGDLTLLARRPTWSKPVVTRIGVGATRMEPSGGFDALGEGS